MTGKFQQQHTRSSTAQLQAHGWQCSLSTFLPVSSALFTAKDETREGKWVEVLLLGG
jgi:hypothetical protein